MRSREISSSCCACTTTTFVKVSLLNAPPPGFGRSPEEGSIVVEFVDCDGTMDHSTVDVQPRCSRPIQGASSRACKGLGSLWLRDTIITFLR